MRRPRDGTPIGGVPASFTAVSDSQIVSTVPSQSAGAGGTACLVVEKPVGDGVDLDQPPAVYFGSVRVTEVANGQNPETGAPESDVVMAVVPNGVVGRTVAVRVVTAESLMRQRNPRSPVNERVEFTFTGAGT